MSQPTLSDLHVNTPLSNMSLAFFQDETAFVADNVFPTLSVPNISDLYITYVRGDFNRNLMKKRAPGAESVGGGYNIDNTANYRCDVWSLHKDIPDQVRANADNMFSLDLEATRYLTTQALISKEIAWASTFFATGVWTTEFSGVASAPSATQFIKWSDPSSQPIEDVRKVKRNVQLAGGGFRPNKIVMSRSVFDTLLDHPDFIDRIKAGQTPNGPAIMNRIAVAQVLELDEVLVMDAIYNTAGEGAPAGPGAGEGGNSETNAFIAGNHAMLCYTPGAPGLMTPAAGYGFSWTGMFGATGNGGRMKSFYIDKEESTRVEIDLAYVYKKVSADLGGFFLNAV